MNRLLIIIFIIPLFSFAGNYDFNAFDKFDRMDKQEFNRLKKEVKKCINNWNFDCARSKLYKMKKYITSKKDNKMIDNLWNELNREEEAKTRYEEAQRRANSNRTYSIENCYAGADGAKCCSLIIDGEDKGHICYQWDSSSNDYKIFPVWGANIDVNGYYDPNLHMIWTTKCGDSSAGSVYGISSALDKFANCVANGYY